jgi:hypothetical protein
MIQPGGMRLKPNANNFEKFGKDCSTLEFNIVCSMLFNSAVDDNIPFVSRLVIVG